MNRSRVAQRTSLNVVTQEILLEPEDNQRLLSLCGPFDDNIKQLERRLGVEINRRDNAFKLVGKTLPDNAAVSVLRALYVRPASLRGVMQHIHADENDVALTEWRGLAQT